MPGIDDVDRQFRPRFYSKGEEAEHERAKEDRAFFDRYVAPHMTAMETDPAAERGVREDCAAAAKAIGGEVEEVPLFAAERFVDERTIEGKPAALVVEYDATTDGYIVRDGAVRWLVEESHLRVLTEPRYRRAVEAVLAQRGDFASLVQPLTQAEFRSHLDDEDRREVRRQALTCACQIADMEWGVNEVLAVAARFERYLLGDDATASTEARTVDSDPPKPPAKME